MPDKRQRQERKKKTTKSGKTYYLRNLFKRKKKEPQASDLKNVFSSHKRELQTFINNVPSLTCQ